MNARILIIDDEPRWSDFLKDNLRPFDVAFAADAKTALSLLQIHQFDLLIVNARCLDVLETIRAIYPNERIVVVTVQPKNDEALRAYRLGAVRYFAKSFSRHDFLNHVKELTPAFAGIASA